MNEDIAASLRPMAVFRSFVPPGHADLPAFVWTAGLLVGLLVAVVPAFALTTTINPLAFVIGAGIVYFIVIVYTGTGFEGLASATIVLSVFDIGVRLAQGPSIIPVTSVSLTIVDFAAVPLLFVFLHSDRTMFSFRRITLNGRTIAAAALAVFVVWTMLSGIVANGESSLVPLLYTVQFFRYALLLVLSALIVRATNPWCVVYPLVLTIGGNLAFALALVIHGGGLKLQALGETPSIILGSFPLGPFHIGYGSYAGGFVGDSREFAIMLLLFIPLVLAVATRHSWLHVLYALMSVVIAVLVIRTADTDAGWAALLLVGVLLVTTFGYTALRDRYRRAAVGVLGAGIVVSAVGIGVALVVIVSASAQAAPSIPLFATNSLPIRIKQYVAAIGIAASHPLSGLGGGNFFLMEENFGLPGLRGIHSIVFSYLAATGFVGAAAYVVGVVAVLGVTFRRFLRGVGSERFLWAALVCGMVGFHAYSLWDLAALWDSALAALWILMGVVIGADAPSNPDWRPLQAVGGSIESADSVGVSHQNN